MGLRFTVPHLRWLVLAGIAAVLYVTVSSYMAQKWKGQQSRHLPQKISADVDQQTQAFTLSKTLGQHTLYTVQAEQVTNFKDTGKAVLRNVSIVLHGSQGQRRDRISTAECEYDPISGLLVAPGEVRMEFQSPPPDSEHQNGATAPAAPVPVSITTTGLSFEQNTGIASTEQTVHFRFPQGEGQSRGASYNPQTEWLTLPEDVQLTLYEGSAPTGQSTPDVSLASKLLAPGTALPPAGTLTGNITRIQAANLLFHRGQRRLLLGAPVEVVQDSRKLRAGNSEIVLDERLQARLVRLSGGIQGTLQSAVTASQMQAASGRLELSENGKIQRVVLQQDVQWNFSTAHSHKEGTARRAELFFTKPGSKNPGGLLERILADGGVRMVMRRSPVADHTARPTAGLQETISRADTQILSAQQAEIFFAPDGETLQRVLTDSASTLQILASQRAEDRWNVQASRFDMDFESEGNLASFRAEGNAKWSAGATDSGSPLRSSTSHALEAFFDPLTHSLTRIQQQGNFYYEDTEKKARAETAVYGAAKEEVRLRGNPVVWNPSGKITAQEIVLDNARQRLTAQGNVSSTYFPEAAAGSPPPETLHGVAERLEYDLATQRAQYQGHSRLWQGHNLLEAGSIELDGQRTEVVARQRVYSLWTGLAATGNGKFPPSPKGSGALAAQRDTYEIWSDSLVYRDAQKQAHYQDSVRMFSRLRTLNAVELELFLRSAPTAGGGFDSGDMRLERAVAKGDVRLAEPERTAEGSKAEYLPEAGNILLYGSPAVVVDSERGSLQGARLTYSIADGRIFLDGEPGVPAQTRWQVRR